MPPIPLNRLPAFISVLFVFVGVVRVFFVEVSDVDVLVCVVVAVGVFGGPFFCGEDVCFVCVADFHLVCSFLFWFAALVP